MRLLYTKNPGDMPEVREFLGTDIPPYATILSHTWGDDEVTLQQLLAGAADPTSLQTQSGLPQDPADTSSAELTEAINSMFAWYRDAAVCYAYLADLESGSFDDLEETLPGCRWSTRGWTLQELMAPEKVLFFDRQWDFRGSKADLAVLISKVTGIPMSLLCHEAELCDFAVARRMSWAAERVTTPASAL